jgi:ATP-dependent DNA ligase
VPQHLARIFATLMNQVGEPMKLVSKRNTDESALSGRTMVQTVAERDKEWQSNRSPAAALTANPRTSEIDFRRTAETELRFIEPIQAELVAELAAGPQPQYEIKLDGYRAQARH